MDQYVRAVVRDQVVSSNVEINNDTLAAIVITGASQAC